MSKSARASFVYAIYAYIAGGSFLLAPNFLFGLFHVPHTDEPWIRVAGVLLCGIATYYTVAAFKQLTVFMQWSVYMRSTTIVFFTVFILIGWFSQHVFPILLGLIDLFTAIWSELCLRADAKALSSPA